MDLQSSLRSIRSLAELPYLVAALGHEPLWEPVPHEALHRGGQRALAVKAIGQTGQLSWFAVESSAPERDGVLLAQRLSRRGKIGMVMALDARNRRLVVVVAFERFPHLEIDLEHPQPDVLVSLSRLAGPGAAGPLGFATRAADALSAEPVGRRFFRAFRATLDRMAAGLPGPMSPAQRHDLVLLQLTRVLFLYFIQAKGWLAGREHFLVEEVDRCLARGRRIHRDLLRPLFFGTLNQSLTTRSRAAARFGLIPFLNGGLFEPHPLERRFRADLPNVMWRDAFEELFERFHFTVTEGDEQGRVAPDMLGRVFEGVMEPEARRATGTFYTPAAVVAQVIDAALAIWLAGQLSCDEAEAERRLADRDGRAAKALAGLTLLDPAVGSGAFLLCALERLSNIGPPSNDPMARKRRVLGRNLFGVDRNAAAVRLCELRLWLAVIADDPADQPEQVSPLPNLDCLIRQGDSLFEPAGVPLAAERGCRSRVLVTELSALRHDIVNASGTFKRALTRRLLQVEVSALTDLLDEGEGRLRGGIAECLDQARTHDLFGRLRGLDAELHDRLSQLRTELRCVRQIRRRLVQEGEVPWFHYQTHFADVFSRGGFDVVVGNPPWLRSEAMPAQLRRQLAGRYRWWRAKPRGYGNSPDLAVAFLERALELASPDGVIAMLVPAKIATAGYATAVRHALASSTTLHVIADLTRCAEADFDATVYPLALVADKRPATPNHRTRTGLGRLTGNRIKQTELQGGGPWVLVPGQTRTAITVLERNHPKIGESLTCHLGVKTGLNQIFLNPPADLEPEVLRWAVRGRDIEDFQCHPSVRLLWTHDASGHPLVRLPSRARAYLEQHDSALRERRDFLGGPPWTLFRARPAVARYRVVWPDLSRQLTATALTTRRDLNRIPLNSCYVVPVSSAAQANALAGYLNSTWLRALARVQAVPASGGFARFNAGLVAALPLPESVLNDPQLIQLAGEGRQGARVQKDLDEIVARHLGLGRAMRSALHEVVDGRSGYSR